jgi:flagellar biosynthesis chaperone FliJ
LEGRVRELSARKAELRKALLHTAASLSGREAGVRKDYLRGLEQDVEAAKDAVFSQRLVVEEVEERLASARSQLAERTRDVEILEKHRDRLEQRYRRDVARKEAIEQDEVGNMLYLSRRRTA